MKGLGLSLSHAPRRHPVRRVRSEWSKGRASYTNQWLLGRPPARAMTTINLQHGLIFAPMGLDLAGPGNPSSCKEDGCAGQPSDQVQGGARRILGGTSDAS